MNNLSYSSDFRTLYYGIPGHVKTSVISQSDSTESDKSDPFKSGHNNDNKWVEPICITDMPIIDQNSCDSLLLKIFESGHDSFFTVNPNKLPSYEIFKSGSCEYYSWNFKNELYKKWLLMLQKILNETILLQKYGIMIMEILIEKKKIIFWLDKKNDNLIKIFSEPEIKGLANIVGPITVKHVDFENSKKN